MDESLRVVIRTLFLMLWHIDLGVSTEKFIKEVHYRGELIDRQPGRGEIMYQSPYNQVVDFSTEAALHSPGAADWTEARGSRFFHQKEPDSGQGEIGRGDPRFGYSPLAGQ